MKQGGHSSGQAKGTIGNMATTRPRATENQCWPHRSFPAARSVRWKCPPASRARDALQRDASATVATCPVPLCRLPCPHKHRSSRGPRQIAMADVRASGPPRCWNAWPAAWPVLDPSTRRSSATTLLPCGRAGKESSWCRCAVKMGAACHSPHQSTHPLIHPTEQSCRRRRPRRHRRRPRRLRIPMACRNA